MPKLNSQKPSPLEVFLASNEIQSLLAQLKASFKESLKEVLEEAFAAIEKQQRRLQRLTTKEAASFLGCSTYHLQDLHKQGLPYEKGRPNRYLQGDLEDYQASRRLG